LEGVNKGDFMNVLNKTVLFFILASSFWGCTANNRLVREWEKHFEDSIEHTPINFADEGRRFYEESGGFSIIPPRSWEAVDMPGVDYKVLIGQRENNYSPNIGFVIEAYDGGLDVFVNSVLKWGDVLLGKNYTVLHRSDFSTLNNLKGEKIIVNLFTLERYFWQNYYFFPGHDNIIIQIACTVFAEYGDAFDDVFDRAVETFEWTSNAEVIGPVP
jgi:hypothetical protein